DIFLKIFILSVSIAELKELKLLFQRPAKKFSELVADLVDIFRLRPLQSTSLHLFADSRNPNTGFRLFSPQIPPNSTQIPP
ncbi:hypothetical protein, partial [Neisseria meningitidis]|uniref:hypothetical protein n=1 Tax=Neisseria meningitidis TaxID=487 RepID=UPI001C8600D9